MTTSLHRIVAAVALYTLWLAASPLGTAEAEYLYLDPAASAVTPRFEDIEDSENGVSFTFDLPAIEVETVRMDGEAFQIVDIPGAELFGEPGSPALPSFTRLVAIPPETGLGLSVEIAEEQTLHGFHIFPMQDLDGNDFIIDRAVYQHAEPIAEPTVTVGAPAVMRGLRVVPVTFRPLGYAPSTQELTVATKIRVNLEYVGADVRNNPTRTDLPRTPAFDHVFESLVVNYGARGRSEN